MLTDFHEMGPNSTYFFQPGIPSRKNPLTPNGNVDLTKAIAKHHARILDSEERLYFTEEAFDDFYVGKGSTYPDVNGSIGILFEQASSQAMFKTLLMVKWTLLSPSKTSSLLASLLLTRCLKTVKLRRLSAGLLPTSRTRADKDKLKGYVVSAPKDATRLDYFFELLAQHQIKAYALEEQTTVDKHTFAAPIATLCHWRNANIDRLSQFSLSSKVLTTIPFMTYLLGHFPMPLTLSLRH